MAGEILSYLLVHLIDDGPKRYRPGMVVDVRDISVPLGRMECAPRFGVIYTETPVADLLDLVEEDRTDVVIALESWSRFNDKRKVALNHGMLTAFLTDGSERLLIRGLKSRQAYKALVEAGIKIAPIATILAQLRNA